MLPRAEDVLGHAVAETVAACWPKPAVAAVCTAMDEVFAMADASWTARRRDPSYLMTAPRIACKAGCGWCCHQQVGVTPLEAVRIAEHIRALPEPERAAMTARIEELDRRTRGLDTSARAATRLSCAFLGAEGSCMIYQVRPLRCRGVFSIDVDFCIGCYEDLPAMRARLEAGELKPVFLDTPERIFNHALGGLLAALKRVRGAVVSLDMTASVRDLLADPRLAARWLAGAKPDRSTHLVPDKT